MNNNPNLKSTVKGRMDGSGLGRACNYAVSLPIIIKKKITGTGHHFYKLKKTRENTNTACWLQELSRIHVHVQFLHYVLTLVYALDSYVHVHTILLP